MHIPVCAHQWAKSWSVTYFNKCVSDLLGVCEGELQRDCQCDHSSVRGKVFLVKKRGKISRGIWRVQSRERKKQTGHGQGWGWASVDENSTDSKAYGERVDSQRVEGGPITWILRRTSSCGEGRPEAGMPLKCVTWTCDMWDLHELWYADRFHKKSPPHVPSVRGKGNDFFWKKEMGFTSPGGMMAFI